MSTVAAIRVAMRVLKVSARGVGPCHGLVAATADPAGGLRLRATDGIVETVVRLDGPGPSTPVVLELDALAHALTGTSARQDVTWTWPSAATSLRISMGAVTQSVSTRADYDIFPAEMPAPHGDGATIVGEQLAWLLRACPTRTTVAQGRVAFHAICADLAGWAATDGHRLHVVASHGGACARTIVPYAAASAAATLATQSWELVRGATTVQLRSHDASVTWQCEQGTNVSFPEWTSIMDEYANARPWVTVPAPRVLARQLCGLRGGVAAEVAYDGALVITQEGCRVTAEASLVHDVSAFFVDPLLLADALAAPEPLTQWWRGDDAAPLIMRGVDATADLTAYVMPMRR